MKEYKQIYPFEVIDQILEGEYVGVLDRERKEAFDVRNLSVAALAVMLSDTDSKNRYAFWIEVETDG